VVDVSVVRRLLSLELLAVLGAESWCVDMGLIHVVLDVGVHSKVMVGARSDTRIGVRVLHLVLPCFSLLLSLQVLEVGSGPQDEVGALRHELDVLSAYTLLVFEVIPN